MFTNFHILNIFNYIRTQKAQYWAILTKSDMEIQRYNRLKAAIKRELNEVHFNSVERKQARRFSSTVRRGRLTQFKIGLAEKEKAGTWLSELMGHSISTVSRWMTNRVKPSVEPLGFAACQSKNFTRLPNIMM